MNRGRALSAVRRLLDAWHRIECAAATVAFGAIALVLVADLIGRRGGGWLLAAAGLPAAATGIPGAPKLAVYAMVIGTWIGVGVASASGAHAVPQFAWRALPAAWRDRAASLGEAATALAFGAAAWFAADMVAASHRHGLVAPMLLWPLWPVQLALPLGLASAALRHAAFAIWPALAPQRQRVGT